MDQIGPIEKVYEAYSAIADGRVHLLPGEDKAEVQSSDKSKTYTVTWHENIYTSNDNASYWQGYAGYPVLAVLMMQGKLSLNEAVSEHFKDVNWTELNAAHKRDYAAAVAEIAQEREIDMESVQSVAEVVMEELRGLDVTMKRGSLRPPKK